MRGNDLRYQNGFDCQGLWVEVEVEKALGLNSKREIEEYGLAEFAARCRERVAEFAEVITEQSKRLGMWMDWDNDYYTFSDTNIEYIWRFLKEVHEPGLALPGPPRDPVVPALRDVALPARAGRRGNYKELDHPSLYVRFPLKDREGEALIVWTTTPWTLPANVAAAVRPDAEYGRARRTVSGRGRAAPGGEVRASDVTGAELVGLEYSGPFDDLPAQGASSTASSRGTRSRSTRAAASSTSRPGAGTEDFELSGSTACRCSSPIDESGSFYPGYGMLEGMPTDEVEEPVVAELARARSAGRGRADHPPLSDLLALPHAARLPRRRRLVHRRRRDARADARRERDGRVDAAAVREADGRLAAQHGRLEHLAEALLRPAAALLPVPVRPPERGRLARGARGARASAGSSGCRSSTARGSTRSRSAASYARPRSRASPRSATPGSTRGSCRSRRSAGGRDEVRPGGYGTGAAKGLTGADLPDHAYWEQWFPADWISEMREQIRLWFYSHVLHVGDARRPLAVPARAHLREAAGRDRPRDAPLVGQRDRRQRGVRPDGRRRHALALLRRSRQRRTSSSATARPAR